MDDQPLNSFDRQDEGLRLLAESLHPDTRVGVLSGAGISAASGIPTFRGPGGMWKSHRPEDLATPAAFARDPRTVWEWYGHRRDAIRAAHPNAAHDALGELARLVGSVSIITQNVDGLHALGLERQGLAGLVEIIELHGSIWKMRCVSCGRDREDLRSGPAEGEDLPTCACGALLRPGVVWFGEQLSDTAISRAAKIAGDCDVFLVVGTAAVVQPAASYARLAAMANALVAEVNLEPTPLSDSLPIALHGKAEEILPGLVAKVRGMRG